MNASTSGNEGREVFPAVGPTIGTPKSLNLSNEINDHNMRGVPLSQNGGIVRPETLKAKKARKSGAYSKFHAIMSFRIEI